MNYDSNLTLVKPEEEQREKIRLVMPKDYDSPILEEVVPDDIIPEGNITTEDIIQENVPGDIIKEENSSLKCPYCSTAHTFNPQSLGTVKNFNCPECSGTVPTVTVMRLANSNEYISSIESVSEDGDKLGLVKDIKESLKTVKTLD